MTSPTSGVDIAPAGRGECPTGKVQFSTRKQARVARSKTARGELNIYRCPSCGWLHLGHLPQYVRDGTVGKDDWLAAKSKPARPRRRKKNFTPADLARIVNNREDAS